MGRATQIISEGAPAGLRVEFVKCRRALRFSGAAIGGSSPVEVPVPPLLDQLDVDREERRAPVRYLLFGGLNGHPRGGVRDVIGVFDSESRARQEFVELRRQRSDHEGWAELAALDARGNLTALGWFGLDESVARTTAASAVAALSPNLPAQEARKSWSRSLRRRRVRRS